MLSFKKDYKKIYEANKEEFKRLVALDQNKPIGTADLKHTCIDLQGKSYYSFTDAVDIPLERLAKIEEYKLWLSSGLHKETVEVLCDKAEEILSSGLTKGKGSAKLGLIISELRERQNMVVPVELLYNLIAVQLVREDENPNVFNNEIHLQKIVALKELSDQSGSFFFGWSELKQLQGWLNMSEAEWVQYWRESTLTHQRRMEALKQVLEKP